MKFLAYGLFGEQLTSSLDADNYATLPFFLIIVGLTIGAVWLISHFRKQHKYMAVMIVFTVYILLIGFDGPLQWELFGYYKVACQPFRCTTSQTSFVQRKCCRSESSSRFFCDVGV